MKPEYLGDGVYIQPGSFHGELVITTGSHIHHEADTIIYLDPSVVRALLNYLTLAKNEKSI